jgi:hypothetical protein
MRYSSVIISEICEHSYILIALKDHEWFSQHEIYCSVYMSIRLARKKKQGQEERPENLWREFVHMRNPCTKWLPWQLRRRARYRAGPHGQAEPISLPDGDRALSVEWWLRLGHLETLQATQKLCTENVKMPRLPLNKQIMLAYGI